MPKDLESVMTDDESLVIDENMNNQWVINWLNSHWYITEQQ